MARIVCPEALIDRVYGVVAPQVDLRAARAVECRRALLAGEQGIDETGGVAGRQKTVPVHVGVAE